MGTGGFKAHDNEWCYRTLVWLPNLHKGGEGGGVFITENYKPYTNTLTLTEQKTLCGLYDKAEGKEKEILFRIIRKYGADKLKI